MIWKSTIKSFKNYLTFERSFSKHTIEAYAHDVNRMVEFFKIKEYSYSPKDVELIILEEFIIWINNLGLGIRSQARLISSLKAFFKYLLLENIIDIDPTELLESPRLQMKIPEVLSFEEIQKIFDAVDLSHPQGTRNKAILETLYACGLRVSELTNLKITDLFFDMDFIKVFGKNKKERFIPIGEEAKKHINIYLDNYRRKQENVALNNENFLFLNRRGKKLSRIMIYNIVKDTAKNAGITKNVSPHTFRHSFASHLIDGGANLRAVQEMLGHESILTTEIYTHLNTDYLKETILSFHPLSKWKLNE